MATKTKQATRQAQRTPGQQAQYRMTDASGEHVAYTIIGGYIVTDEGLNSRIVAAIDAQAGVERAEAMLRKLAAHDDLVAALREIADGTTTDSERIIIARAALAKVQS